MRTVFREELQAYRTDILEMCGLAQENMAHASRALLDLDLEAAEEALSGSDAAVELQQRCDERALSLLALESPVATDLRQVLAYIHMQRDLVRMSNLAKLIAKRARLIHPAPVVPEELHPRVEQMADVADQMAARVIELVAGGAADDESVGIASELNELDDRIDEIAGELLAAAIAEDWAHSNRAAVELALLCRYYERFGDHCVSIARRVDFVATGVRPNVP